MLKNKKSKQQLNRAARIKRLKNFLRNDSPTRQLWSSQLRAHVLSIAQLQHLAALLLDWTWHTFTDDTSAWAAVMVGGTDTSKDARAHTPRLQLFTHQTSTKRSWQRVAAHAHQPRDHRSGCRRCQSADTHPGPLVPTRPHAGIESAPVPGFLLIPSLPPSGANTGTHTNIN